MGDCRCYRKSNHPHKGEERLTEIEAEQEMGKAVRHMVEDVLDAYRTVTNDALMKSQLQMKH